MIDNIITNTMLPALSREILKRSLEAKEISTAAIVMRDGKMAYDVA